MSEPLLPLVGSARTVHHFLRNHEEQWFTISEIAQMTGLREESVRTALSAVMLDPRIVRGKRPQTDRRSLDEYAFLPFLSERTRPGGGE
jgi:hypothetical protein